LYTDNFDKETVVGVIFWNEGRRLGEDLKEFITTTELGAQATAGLPLGPTLRVGDTPGLLRRKLSA
jgi:hypothetical protein